MKLGFSRATIKQCLLPVRVRQWRLRRYIHATQNSQPSVANVLYREIKSASSDLEVDLVLCRLGIEPKWFSRAVLQDLVSTVKGDRGLKRPTSDALDRLISDECDPISLLIFYDTYRRCGMYYYGFPYRELALLRVRRMGYEEVLRSNLAGKFLAANLELAKYDEAIALLCHLANASNKGFRIPLDELEDVAAFWSESNHLSNSLKHNNEDYWNFLAGKSIALVGPSEGKLGDAEEINEFDLVVRLNYSFEGKGIDIKTKGARTDITYFMRHHGEAFINEQKGNLPSELKWAVIKDADQLRRVKHDEKQSLKILEGEPQRSINFHASYTAIPCVLTDILRYPFARLKIFHCDLNLTVMRAYGYSPQSFNRDTPWEQKRDLNRAFHDPVTNLNFLKMLHMKKHIEADVTLTQVLNLSVEEYLSQLQEKYDESSWIDQMR